MMKQFKMIMTVVMAMFFILYKCDYCFAAYNMAIDTAQNISELNKCMQQNTCQTVTTTGQQATKYWITSDYVGPLDQFLGNSIYMT